MRANQRATIYNGWDRDGNPLVEGAATLKELRKTSGHSNDAELWMVEFDEEPGELYQRTVFNEHIINEEL